MNPSPGPTETRVGVSAAVGAYLLWGFLPLYFLLLAPASPWEIVAWRIVMSLAFCAILLTAMRSWPGFARAFADRALMRTMFLAGALIFVNWLVFLIAALSGRVVEAALGYFINPVVTVFLGVLVLRERLNRWQWAAVGLSIVAFLVIAFGYGEVPWISLALAVSFGFYGLIKRRVGPRVDATTGLAIETLVLVPVAVVVLGVIAATGGLTFGRVSAAHTIAMVGVGAITAIPLLFFAAAARRLPLVALGFFQYLAPIFQLLVGVVILHEPMPLERWIGFALVWAALIILTVNAVAKLQRAPERVI
ncbi:MAG TPA: EamA family transporter RarD [Candidatus Lumbricidophila sp.]|nr:EamA family transporter RarD [Candidatus Lumbricidophila sp.]